MYENVFEFVRGLFSVIYKKFDIIFYYIIMYI